MSQLILALDSAGSPNRWISLQDAIMYHAKGLVAWQIGEQAFEMRGGISRLTGEESRIETSSIIAIKGRDFMVRHYDRVPALERSMLFNRDRHLCAYCGQVFRTAELEIEHVMPRSRGGADLWTNVVTACRHCNMRKGAQTPEEAHMPLLYVPYTPNRHEAFILANRRILADQMEFLLQGVPRHSRLLKAA